MKAGKRQRSVFVVPQRLSLTNWPVSLGLMLFLSSQSHLGIEGENPNHPSKYREWNQCHLLFGGKVSPRTWDLTSVPFSRVFLTQVLSTKGQFLVRPLCGNQYSFITPLLSASLQWLLYTLAPNSCKEIVSPSERGWCCSVKGRCSRERRHVEISLSLHSALTINTTVLVKHWEEGKTFTVHTCLTKEGETVIKTTALLMVCWWAFSRR